MPSLPLKISFSKPKHGWVDITLAINEQEFHFDTSDTPNNPFICLTDALHYFASGNQGSQLIWFNGEPSGYYLELTRTPIAFLLSLSFEPNSMDAQRKTLAFLKGSPKGVLMPLWRGIKCFNSYEFDEPDWPITPFGNLIHLKNKISKLP